MPSVGLSELILVTVIALLVLKPQQLVSAWVQIKGLLFKVRQYTGKLEQEFHQAQKEKLLQERISQAAKVSDVSDLMDHHEP